MRETFIGGLLGIVVGALGVWAWFYVASALGRRRRGERYESFREMAGPSTVLPFGDRLHDWSNQTAERVTTAVLGDRHKLPEQVDIEEIQRGIRRAQRHEGQPPTAV
jgi:hypothetical protein